MSLEQLQRKNQALRNHLGDLGGAVPPPIKKDNTAYLVYKEQIDNLKLEIERKELLVEHTKQELHDDHEEMRRLQKKMDAARNIGKAVWESTGFQLQPHGVSYFPPYPLRLRLSCVAVLPVATFAHCT